MIDGFEYLFCVALIQARVQKLYNSQPDISDAAFFEILTGLLDILTGCTFYFAFYVSSSGCLSFIIKSDFHI